MGHERSNSAREIGCQRTLSAWRQQGRTRFVGGIEQLCRGAPHQIPAARAGPGIGGAHRARHRHRTGRNGAARRLATRRAAQLRHVSHIGEAGQEAEHLDRHRFGGQGFDESARDVWRYRPNRGRIPRPKQTGRTTSRGSGREVGTVAAEGEQILDPAFGIGFARIEVQGHGPDGGNRFAGAGERALGDLLVQRRGQAQHAFGILLGQFQRDRRIAQV